MKGRDDRIFFLIYSDNQPTGGISVLIRKIVLSLSPLRLFDLRDLENKSSDVSLEPDIQPGLTRKNYEPIKQLAQVELVLCISGSLAACVGRPRRILKPQLLIDDRLGLEFEA